MSIVRGYDSVSINGLDVDPIVKSCFFDLNTKVFNVTLTNIAPLSSLVKDSARSDFFVVVDGVEYEGRNKFVFQLSNPFRYLNLDLIEAESFEFNILSFFGEKSCMST